MGRSSDDPGAPDQSQERLRERRMGWFFRNRKTGCRIQTVGAGACSQCTPEAWLGGVSSIAGPPLECTHSASGPRLGAIGIHACSVLRSGPTWPGGALTDGAMGRRERQIPGLALAKDEQLRRHRAMHRSLCAHLTRPVADPAQPGRWITDDEGDQRLRGRADRRQVALACHQAPHC